MVLTFDKIELVSNVIRRMWKPLVENKKFGQRTTILQSFSLFLLSNYKFRLCYLRKAGAFNGDVECE